MANKKKSGDAVDTVREEGIDTLRAHGDDPAFKIPLDDEQPKVNGQDQDRPEPSESGNTIGPLALVDIGAWQDQPIPRQEWLVLNRVPHENVTLLSGDGATGKTTIAADLCAATCLGSDWLGAVVEQGSVLFYTGEETEKEMHRRLAAIFSHRHCEFRDLAGKLHLHCRPADDPTLGYPDRSGIIRATPVFLRLQEAVRDIRPRLVCIEAVADTFGGDETKRAQVRQFIGMLRGDLAIRCHTAVVLLQHPSQAGLASGSGTSGSTHWNNSCRSRLYLSTVRSDPDAEPDNDLRKLEVMKANYGPRGEIIKVRWKAGVFVMEGGTSSLDKLARNNQVDDVFLRLLRRLIDQRQQLSPNKGPTYAPTKFARHEEANGTTSKEFDRAMQRLIDAGKIHIRVTGPDSKKRSWLAVGPRESLFDIPSETPTRRCSECDEQLDQSARADARFCSDKCRLKAHRKHVTDNSD
jgi:RecA-family ATPase